MQAHFVKLQDNSFKDFAELIIYESNTYSPLIPAATLAAGPAYISGSSPLCGLFIYLQIQLKHFVTLNYVTHIALLRHSSAFLRHRLRF